MARNINELHPTLQMKVDELKALCAREGLALGIGECFRSVAEQDALYAQGRTAPGSIVTNAEGSTYSSQHQWGIAFDFFKNIKGEEYNDNSFFTKIGALAKSIGLGWGGDWTSPVDKPHLYLPDWGSTTTKLKSQYGSFDKFRATWGGWKQNDTGWWYQNADGTYPKSQWLGLDAWYWFDERGYAIHDKWELIGGKWYYFNSDCRMATGWLHVNNQWYFLSESGAMVTGLQTIGHALYYFAADGHMCRTNEGGALI